MKNSMWEQKPGSLAKHEYTMQNVRAIIHYLLLLDPPLPVKIYYKQSALGMGGASRLD